MFKNSKGKAQFNWASWKYNQCQWPIRKRKTSQEAHENSVSLNNKKMLDLQENPVGKVTKSKTNAIMFDPTLKVSQSRIWTKLNPVKCESSMLKLIQPWKDTFINTKGRTTYVAYFQSVPSRLCPRSLDTSESLTSDTSPAISAQLHCVLLHLGLQECE